ncbi:MAG: S-methyl-5-thioribose-1-phosphate isomerase [Pseudomonadota bacterium]
MKIDGVPHRTIAVADDGWRVSIIDQTRLPHAFQRTLLETREDAAHAIKAMLVRGAPLIGATAVYGVCLAMRADPSDEALADTVAFLAAQRPTAINLRWALDDIAHALRPVAEADRVDAAYAHAAALCDADTETNRQIGVNARTLIEGIAEVKGGAPVNILTHCNAGWLACVDWGTATSPIYQAHDAGVKVHVWVDETRPRNQGAALTCWELGAHGVPHTLIVDNAGGHLMQRGDVDICFVGTDRTTANGDVCNKIGTYLKALAAHDNGIPFYVTLPFSTIDWSLNDGFATPIEDRDAREVTHIAGKTETGVVTEVAIVPLHTSAANPAFDVTPGRLVTGLVTERGICEASASGLRGLYPEQAKVA